MDHKNFMRVAIALAEKNVADVKGGPFGAVVVRDGRIVGEGVSRVTPLNDPTAHAEMAAIRQASAKLNVFSLAGCVIYTSCEPCPMCLGAIYWARLDRIFCGNTSVDASRFDFDDDYIYKEISKPIGERAIPTEWLLAEEAIKAFKDWSVSEFKVPH